MRIKAVLYDNRCDEINQNFINRALAFCKVEEWYVGGDLSIADFCIADLSIVDLPIS
ncbi:MAG: hypothetical protein LBS02_08195 [Hungatella sp.]|jgi:hypothetical protein|nr:hypothetical protein [Hungatella sp.]